MTDAERLGADVTWEPAALPQRIVLQGQTVRVEPVSAARHGADLFGAISGPDADPDLWSYLGYGPFDQEDRFIDHLAANEASTDPLYFAVVNESTGTAQGVASLMRLDPVNGVAEVGHIWFGAGLQRTTAGTEAIYLLADYVMTDMGYRRFEWKCNDLNQRSRRAAERFGFTYEGTFRHHMVVKGRNRDTAWYSIIDTEWPAVRAGFLAWLDPENFDAEGRQRRSLQACRANPASG